MRNVLFALVMLLASLAPFSEAHAMHANAQVRANNLRVEAWFTNNTSYRFACSGRVWGDTYRGHRVWQVMDRVTVLPGNTANIYVYTNSNDPFVAGNTNIQCVTY